jgi:hypothetical protein
MKNKSMKNILVILGIAAFLFAGFTCFAGGTQEAGSGAVKTTSTRTEPFSHILVSGITNFEIVQADEYSVVLTADENIIDQINVMSQGSQLALTAAKDVSNAATVLKAVITAPAVENITIRGNASGYLADYSNADNLTIDIGGNGSLTISDSALKANELSLKVGGLGVFEGQVFADTLVYTVYGGSLTLSGEADSVNGWANGGEVNMTDFVSLRSDMNFSGDSEANIDLEGFYASDASNIAYLTLSDESVVTVKSEGSVNADVSNEAELYYSVDYLRVFNQSEDATVAGI